MTEKRSIESRVDFLEENIRLSSTQLDIVERVLMGSEDEFLEIKQTYPEVRDDLSFIKLMIHGDKSLGFAGLKDRMDTVEKLSKDLLQDKKNQKTLVKGFTLAVTFVGGSSALQFLIALFGN